MRTLEGPSADSGLLSVGLDFKKKIRLTTETKVAGPTPALEVESDHLAKKPVLPAEPKVAKPKRLLKSQKSSQKKPKGLKLKKKKTSERDFQIQAVPKVKKVGQEKENPPERDFHTPAAPTVEGAAPKKQKIPERNFRARAVSRAERFKLKKEKISEPDFQTQAFSKVEGVAPKKEKISEPDFRTRAVPKEERFKLKKEKISEPDFQTQAVSKVEGFKPKKRKKLEPDLWAQTAPKMSEQDKKKTQAKGRVKHNTKRFGPKKSLPDQKNFLFGRDSVDSAQTWRNEINTTNGNTASTSRKVPPQGVVIAVRETLPQRPKNIRR